MRIKRKYLDISTNHDFCWNVFGFEFTVHYWPNKSFTRHKCQLTIFVQFLWWSGHLSFDCGKRPLPKRGLPVIKREPSITSNGVNL